MVTNCQEAYASTTPKAQKESKTQRNSKWGRRRITREGISIAETGIARVWFVAARGEKGREGERSLVSTLQGKIRQTQGKGEYSWSGPEDDGPCTRGRRGIVSAGECTMREKKAMREGEGMVRRTRSDSS